jgi:serine/threonine protein kinase
VKYGVDINTKQAYAIKIIDLSMIKKEKMEDQLKREISIMKILKHKHVVQLREVLQSSKNIYIVLELVTGGELFDKIILAKKFDEDRARKYFQQIILGMIYCHSNGVAHRDLKVTSTLFN